MSIVDLPDDAAGFTPGGSAIPIATLAAVGAGATASTPVIPCAQYSSLWLQFTAIPQQNARYSLTFFADPLGATQVGLTLNFDKNTLQQTETVIPVLGPFFQISVKNNGGVNLAAGFNCAGFTIGPQLSVTRVRSFYLPVNQQSVAIGASATVTVNPTDPVTTNTDAIPGRAKVSGEAGVNCTAELQMWDGTAWDIIAIFSMPALTPVNIELAFPLADWRFQVINQTAGASTFTLTVVMLE